MEERNGADTYKLRNGPEGKLVKSSKTEFTEMCNHSNIQANNPCALLTGRRVLFPPKWGCIPSNA